MLLVTLFEKFWFYVCYCNQTILNVQDHFTVDVSKMLFNPLKKIIAKYWPHKTHSKRWWKNRKLFVIKYLETIFLSSCEVNVIICFTVDPVVGPTRRI